MKAQTAWMMYAGGYNWQFGKRSVDAMSNEEFNKRSADYSVVIADQHIVFREIVSAMNREITEISVVQKDLVDKMVELERMKIEVLPELIGQIPPAFFSGLRDYISGVGDIGSNADVNKFRPPPGSPAPSGPKIPSKPTVVPAPKPRGTEIKTTFSGSEIHHFGEYKRLSDSILAMGKGPSSSQRRAHGSFHSQRDILVRQMRIHSQWIAKNNFWHRYGLWLAQ